MPGSVGVVLLAGGGGTRIGGLDKASLRLDGSTLLDRALQALAGLEVVVVGPPRPLGPVRVVREDPPRSGPAAAVVAGVRELPGSDEILLLAVDLPRLPEAVATLRDAPMGPDGTAAIDPEGRAQWLLGRYRGGALRDAVERFGDPAGRSLRSLLADLDLTMVRLPRGVEADVDTVADAERVGVALPVEEAR